jgi:hypothetical protein
LGERGHAKIKDLRRIPFLPFSTCCFGVSLDFDERKAAIQRDASDTQIAGLTAEAAPVATARRVGRRMAQRVHLSIPVALRDRRQISSSLR